MEAIKMMHGILRWAVLLLAIYAIIKALMGMQGKSAFNKGDNMAGILFTSVVDVQLLLGLALYFTSGLGLQNIKTNGMKFVMSDPYARFFAVEHITGMIIALIIIHVGRAISKKATTDLGKHKTAFWYYLIGLIVILATIPWPFKKGFEAIGWY